MNSKKIVVVGSANMDMVVKTTMLPAPGETVFAATFDMYPGGKGANQAVCAAKLGGQVHFVGKMGRDTFGDDLRESMTRDGVCTHDLMVDREYPTGTALITVDSRGQNHIVVVSGSNMELSPDDVLRKKTVFKDSAVLLLQLEIPLKSVIRAAKLAHANGAQIILNPAPACRLPQSLLRLVDFLTPNEHELAQVTGLTVSDLSSTIAAARHLLTQGVRNVIVTLGDKGSLLVNDAMTREFPARKVRAVDSTAAGDAFNGALAYVLAAGKDVESAIRFANTVAAFSVRRRGAQTSMPTRREILKFGVQSSSVR